MNFNDNLNALVLNNIKIHKLSSEYQHLDNDFKPEITSSITNGATDDITAFHSSDEKLKNNVVRIEDGLSIVNQLRPVEYEWDELSPFSHLKHNDYGLIAQEVEKVLPNIVGEMKDGYKGIRYEKLIPFLIDSIQQLTKRVEKLEKQNKLWD